MADGTVQPGRPSRASTNSHGYLILIALSVSGLLKPDDLGSANKRRCRWRRRDQSSLVSAT